MNHQKCRICGERHPLGPCPQFKFKPSAAKNTGPVTFGGLPLTRGDGKPIMAGDLQLGPNEVVVAPKTRAPRGTFDRTAYQREYMRQRRAQKAHKP